MHLANSNEIHILKRILQHNPLTATEKFSVKSHNGSKEKLDDETLKLVGRKS